MESSSAARICSSARPSRPTSSSSSGGIGSASWPRLIRSAAAVSAESGRVRLREAPHAKASAIASARAEAAKARPETSNPSASLRGCRTATSQRATEILARATRSSAPALESRTRAGSELASTAPAPSTRSIDSPDTDR